MLLGIIPRSQWLQEEAERRDHTGPNALMEGVRKELWTQEEIVERRTRNFASSM